MKFSLPTTFSRALVLDDAFLVRRGVHFFNGLVRAQAGQAIYFENIVKHA